MKVITFFMRVVLVLPIWGYRILISPFTPPSCRFEPSCSAYALQAIERHGVWAGFWLSVGRLSRCHPVERLGADSGFDPVPVEILSAPWYAPWRLKASDEEMTKS